MWLTIAENGLHLFVIIVIIGLPSFAVAEIVAARSQSSRVGVIVGCFLTALIIVLFLFLDREKKIRPLPAPRGVMAAAAIAAVLIGFGGIAWPYIWGESHEIQSPLKRGRNIVLKFKPFRIAVGPDGLIWTATKGGLIHGVDGSLRQPVGITFHAGHALHDINVLGRFIFSTIGRGKVVRIDPDPTGAKRLTGKFGESGGDVIDNGHSLFVNDRLHAVIFHLSPDLRLRHRIVVNTNPKAHATAMALGGDGSLWVIDAGLNALYKISLQSYKVVLSKTIPPGPSALLVVDKTVYIAHPKLGLIEMRDGQNGTLLPGRISIDPGPTHLLAADGLLFICNAKTRTVASARLGTGEPVGSGLTVGGMPTDLDFDNVDGKRGWVAYGDSGVLTPVSVLPKSEWPKSCPCALGGGDNANALQRTAYSGDALRNSRRRHAREGGAQAVSTTTGHEIRLGDEESSFVLRSGE